MARNLARKRFWISTTLVGASILAVAGVNAYRTFFARPGEDALRLVPKDALMVATLDLSPSPQQALVFKKIEDALAKHGMDKQLDGSLLDLVAAGSPALEQLRPYGTRAGAFASLAGEKKDGPLFVGYIGLTDGPAVQAILKKSAKAMFWRGTQYFQLTKNSMAVMVVGNHLVMGDNKSLNRVEASIDAKDSILNDPSFVAARAAVDADANMMMFMSPRMGEMFADASAVKPAQKFASDWVAMGLAIRDEGIGMTSIGKVDIAQVPSYKHFASMPFLRKDLMASLPSGAYGVVAMSAPAKFMDFADEVMADTPDVKKNIDEASKQMLENVGVGLREDLMPALKGNVVLGAYPSDSGKGGANALIVLDDSNGATPGALAEKFMGWLDKQIKEGGKEGEGIESAKRGDATVWKLSGKAEESFRKGMAGEGSEKAPFDLSKLAGDKTITVAVQGNSVVASTSIGLLDRALASLATKQGGLDQDALWAPHSALFGDAQQAVGLSFSRIAEGVRDTMKFENMSEADAKSAKEVIDAFAGLTRPMTMKAAMDDKGGNATLFIPLDYPKVIDFIGKMMEGPKKDF